MDNNLKVCRLCLEIIDNHNFETLDAVKLAMLKILPLVLSPAYTTNALICSQCSDKLQQIFYFKTACLNNNDYLKTFLHHGNNFELILEEIFAREISTLDEIKHEEEKVCRFCLKYFDMEVFTKLNRLEEDIFLKDMVEKCLPEMDLKVTKVPLICQQCMDGLQNQFNFVISCLDVDERIQNFKLSVAADNDQHDLSDVLKFDGNHIDLNDIKLEKESDNDVGYISEVVVKKEEVFDDIKEFKFQEKEGLEVNVKNEEMTSGRCIKIEEKLISDLDSDEGMSDSTCQSGQLTFPEPESLEKNAYGMFVCNFCPHQTNRRDSLVTHFLTHRRKTDTSEFTQFKCKECDFVTKWNSSLRSHVLLHKNPTELELFYCAKCPYKSKHKKHVKRHSKRHMKSKSLSTTLSSGIYECRYCPVKTRDKYYYKQHNKLKHDKNIMLPFEKCEQCDYESRNERNILIHMRIMHNIVKAVEPVKVKVKEYACESCDFKTPKLYHFKEHSLKHKSCAEVNMFNCAKCSFQTKYRNSIISHLKRHRVGCQPQNMRRENARGASGRKKS